LKDDGVTFVKCYNSASFLVSSEIFIVKLTHQNMVQLHL